MGIRFVSTILLASYLTISLGQYSLYTDGESGYVRPYFPVPYRRPHYVRPPSWRYEANRGVSNSAGRVNVLATLIGDVNYLGFNGRYGWGYYNHYDRRYYGRFIAPHIGREGFGVLIHPAPLWLSLLISIHPRQDNRYGGENEMPDLDGGRPQGPPGSDEEDSNVETGIPGTSEPQV